MAKRTLVTLNQSWSAAYHCTEKLSQPDNSKCLYVGAPPRKHPLAPCTLPLLANLSSLPYTLALSLPNLPPKSPDPLEAAVPTLVLCAASFSRGCTKHPPPPAPARASTVATVGATQEPAPLRYMAQGAYGKLGSS